MLVTPEKVCQNLHLCHVNLKLSIWRAFKLVYAQAAPLMCDSCQIQVKELSGDLQMSREEVLYFVNWLRSLPKETREAMRESIQAAESAVAERKTSLQKSETVGEATEKLTFQGTVPEMHSTYGTYLSKQLLEVYPLHVVIQLPAGSRIFVQRFGFSACEAPALAARHFVPLPTTVVACTTCC